MPSPPPAILLMGPTASGKTDLAIQLAAHLPCEVISVDSALVYRGMDIGAAKPTPEELARTPHRLIDICDPDEAYSAARFCEDALAAMAEITAAGRIPLLVGGTMLYYRALQYGLSKLPEGDPELRRHLEAQAAAHGWAWMHARLAQIDPASAARIHRNDPQRIQRALEVHALTGRPLSEQQCLDGAGVLPYSLVKLARAPRERAVLHQRIAERFHRMLENGFEAEVRSLMMRYPDAQNLPAMRAVGYRQMIHHLNGDYDRATMIEKGIVATRQLAKRQFTWLRAESGLHWLFDEDGAPLPAARKIIGSTLGVLC